VAGKVLQDKYTEYQVRRARCAG